MPKTMKATFVTESSLRRQDAGREPGGQRRCESTSFHHLSEAPPGPYH